jgi:hypothetical protein
MTIHALKFGRFCLKKAILGRFTAVIYQNEHFLAKISGLK